MTDQMPNIVLVMADQMTPFMLEACGYPLARTQHMSALAARAVNFTAAYMPSPICAPALSAVPGTARRKQEREMRRPWAPHLLDHAGENTMFRIQGEIRLPGLH